MKDHRLPRMSVPHCEQPVPDCARYGSCENVYLDWHVEKQRLAANSLYYLPLKSAPEPKLLQQIHVIAHHISFVF